jgi:hypothetical protein
VVQTQIAHKSRNYLIIVTNFTSKEGMVFYNEPLEKVKPCIFCMNFLMGFYGSHFMRQIIVEKIL